MTTETQSELKVDTVAVFFDAETVEAAVKELNDDGLVEYSGGRMWKWKGEK